LRFLLFLILSFGFCQAQWGSWINENPRWGGNVEDVVGPCEWTVTNTNNSGSGSLRQMVIDAASGDTICFDESVTGTITLTTGEISISKDLNIIGPGADVLEVSGNDASRIFNISGSGIDVKITGLTITEGLSSAVAARGGAIFNDSNGLVTIEDCIIENSESRGSTNSARGGAIHNTGVRSSSHGPGDSQLFTIRNCIIRGNLSTATSSVTQRGGGVSNYSSGSLTAWMLIEKSVFYNNNVIGTGTNEQGGGISNEGFTNITITNTTISGNQASHAGGLLPATTTTLNFVTIANNSLHGTGNGGGITGTLTNVSNSIIADNTDTAGADDVGSCTITNLLNTIIGDDTGLTTTNDLGGNLLDTDPLLSALTEVSDTWIHPINPCSPAWDAADCGSITEDQRGIERPQSDECDIGSYEVEIPYPVVGNVVVNGDFSDFTMDNDDSTKGHWIFDSTYHGSAAEIVNDLSGNGNNLTATGFSVNYVDELTVTSPIYQGGKGLTFNGTSEKFHILAASAGDFNLGTGDGTFDVRLKTGANFSAIRSIVDKGGAFGPTNKEYILSISTASQFRTSVLDGSGSAWINGSSFNTGVSTSTDYFFSVTLDRDGNQILYKDGSQVDIQTVSNSVDISDTDNFEIGVTRGNLQWFLGTIYEIRYSNIVMTSQQIKESYGLAKGWRTGTGSIAPTNQNFAQRFTNSASITDLMQQTVTTLSGECYQLKFDGYRVSGSGNLTINLSGAHSTTQTYNNISPDTHLYYFTTTTTALTLKIYGSNASDVYQIDNISISKID
jgi:hypothetical protein